MSDKVPLKDWMDLFSTPAEDLPLAKEIKQMRESLDAPTRIANINPEDTMIGKQLAEMEKLRADLQKIRQEFSDYRAEETAYHSAEEHRTKIAERKGIWIGALTTIIGGIIVGLFIYYWPSIIAFFSGLFH